jgi:hypothetical protein
MMGAPDLERLMGDPVGDHLPQNPDTGAARALFGSTTQQVVRSASGAVLTVRRTEASSAVYSHRLTRGAFCASRIQKEHQLCP